MYATHVKYDEQIMYKWYRYTGGLLLRSTIIAILESLSTPSMDFLFNCSLVFCLLVLYVKKFSKPTINKIKIYEKHTYQSNNVVRVQLSNLLQPSVQHVNQIAIPGVQFVQFGGDDVGAGRRHLLAPEGVTHVHRRVRVQERVPRLLDALAPYLLLRLDC